MLVDVRGLWDVAGRHFSGWFLSAALLTNFIYVRGRARLSFFKAMLASVAMTALAVVALPLSILVVELVSPAIPNVRKFDALTPVGQILVLLIFALISAAFQSVLLRRPKHKLSLQGFWLLVLVNAFCLVLAFTWIYFHTGPVVAKDPSFPARSRRGLITSLQAAARSS